MIDDRQALEEALHRLLLAFPDVPQDVVASIFGSSYVIVVDETGEPLVDKAEDLATLRLEARTRHPALATALEDGAVESQDEDRATIRATARRVRADAERTRDSAARLAAEVRQVLETARRRIADADGDRYTRTSRSRHEG